MNTWTPSGYGLGWRKAKQCLQFYSIYQLPSTVQAGGGRQWVTALREKDNNISLCPRLGTTEWFLGWNAEKHQHFFKDSVNWLASGAEVPWLLHDSNERFLYNQWLSCLDNQWHTVQYDWPKHLWKISGPIYADPWVGLSKPEPSEKLSGWGWLGRLHWSLFSRKTSWNDLLPLDCFI